MQSELSHALSRVNKEYAKLVTDPLTKINPVPTPFLSDYAIYAVKHFVPHRSVMFYVGFAPGKRAFVLTGKPDNFSRLAHADSVVIDSPEVAISYEKVYLDTTRSMNRLFYLVDLLDDVMFRPKLNAEEKQTKATFVNQNLIAPATVEESKNKYIVTQYAVREQALERHVVTIDKKGNIKTNVAVVERNLPLVYGH
jgi:hypothetical protein